MKHSSKLESGGHMNENAIHGAPKKGREWRIALSNNYAWLILVGEGCMNENAIHGPSKRLKMENCTKQSLRIAPNSKVEDT